jgi:hypothetical protein
MLAVQRFTATGAIDAAFRLYRQHFIPLFPLSLVVGIPGTVMSLFGVFVPHAMSNWAGGSESEAEHLISGIGNTELLLLVAVVGFLVTWVVAVVASMFGVAAATRIASLAALGRKPSLGDALLQALQVFWPLLGATLLSGLAAMIGFFMFIIPCIIIFLGLAFVAPVVVIERTGALDAIARSWWLTQGRRLKLFGAIMLVAFLVMAAGGGVIFVGAIGLFGQGLVQEIVQQLLTQAISVLAMPIWWVVVVLLYYDARVEREAFDVQMLAQASVHP